jgi:hypothetical protein
MAFKYSLVDVQVHSSLVFLREAVNETPHRYGKFVVVKVAFDKPFDLLVERLAKVVLGVNLIEIMDFALCNDVGVVEGCDHRGNSSR